MKNIFEELEKKLMDQGLIEEEVTPPCSKFCQWGGEDGCHIKPPYLKHYRIGVYSGWFCPECAWLASCANDLVESDHS